MGRDKKVAFVTGVTGQDGSYLTELLLSKGYEVHGMVRRTSTFNRQRIEHIINDARYKDSFRLHYGDLGDSGSIARLLEHIRPDEIYNLGAQSHVRVSFDVPEYTADTIALGTLRMLEAMRKTGLKARFYQASSSEMFGAVSESPQNENTPFRPRSIYGIAKLFAHWATVNYREAYNIFAVSGILFNHESPRRGENFVTRKITMSIAEILAGKRDKVLLGNLDAKRDWGYAPEYVEAMWKMLQKDRPDDYVIATGEAHTVREFVEEAFRLAGISDWKKYVGIDEKYHRPTEVNFLVGDSSKAKKELGWEPKIKFKELVKIMLEADAKRLGVKLPS